MLSTRFVALLLITGACVTNAAVADPVRPDFPQLTLTTELLAPSSLVARGGAAGIATDKVREAMRRSGVAYRIEMLPWQRAYHAALTRPATCVYSTTRTPEREALFKWAGPTDIAQWVLVGRAGSAPRLGSLADARGLRIGTYNGDAKEVWLRSRGFSVDSTSNDGHNLDKLMAGRIDLWAVSMRSGSKVLARHGYEGKLVPLLVFNKIGVYLACNRSVPDALVARLNTAFAAIARDGTGRRIERSYEKWGQEGRRP